MPRILHAVARDPFQYTEAIGVTVLFTLALGFAYFLMYSLAVVGRELDVERSGALQLIIQPPRQSWQTPQP